MAEAGSWRSMLEQPGFRMLTLSRFTSRTAQFALSFALVLLIVDATGKAFFSSLLVLALVVPSTVAGVAAGALADAVPKRVVIATANLLRAAICVAFIVNRESVEAYFVTALTLATAAQFATNSEGAALSEVVRREDMPSALAIGQASGGAAQFLGLAVLAPVGLRVLDSPEVLFALCAVLFVVAAIHGSMIRPSARLKAIEVGRHHAEGSWWSTGWRVLRSDPQVMQAATELTLISSALIILGGLIPSFIRDVLGLPVEVGAVVLVPAAVGIWFGLRVSAVLAHRVSHSSLSTAGFVGFVVLLALLSFVNKESEFLAGYGAFSWFFGIKFASFDGGELLSMFVLGPLGFAYALVTVSAQTVLNNRVPMHLHGRVGSTQAALAALASSGPVLLAGLLADLVGVQPVIFAVAIVTGTFAVMNLRRAGSS